MFVVWQNNQQDVCGREQDAGVIASVMLCSEHTDIADGVN